MSDLGEKIYLAVGMTIIISFLLFGLSLFNKVDHAFDNLQDLSDNVFEELDQ